MLNSRNVVTSPVIAADSTSVTDEREQPGHTTKPIYVEVALLSSIAIEVLFFLREKKGLVHYETDRIFETRSDA